MCVGIRVCVFRFLTENSGMQILNRSFCVTFLFVFLMDLIVNCSKCKPKTSLEQWLCVVSSLTARYYVMTEIFSVVFQVLFCFFLGTVWGETKGRGN